MGEGKKHGPQLASSRRIEGVEGGGTVGLSGRGLGERMDMDFFAQGSCGLIGPGLGE